MDANNPNRVVFLRGKKVILRPPSKSTDLETFIRWINDPEVRLYVKCFLPVTEGEEEKWFDELAGRRTTDVVLVIETHDGTPIGIMGLHRISWKDRTATTGALIGEKEYWGKGYGTDAKMTLLDYAFNTLNLRKVCSSTLAFNERSIRYNQRCGYKEEGRRREQFFRNGGYVDEVLLAVFKKDWTALWEQYQKST